MEPTSYQALDSLVFLTNRIGRQLAQRIWHKLAGTDLDISPHHMGVLADLWQQDGLRQQDLAISLIKDKATIARMINHLEENNIVVRIDDPQDKRIKRIYLTHKGKKLKEKIVPCAEQTTKEFTAGISEHELKVCKKVLRQIYEYSIRCARNEISIPTNPATNTEQHD